MTAPTQKAETGDIGEAQPQRAHRRIMYVCSDCEENFPEGCGRYDPKDLVVMPDGRWLCDRCFDEDRSALVEDEDHDLPDFWDMPHPPMYAAALSAAGIADARVMLPVFDATDLDMIRRGDMLGSKLGEKVYRALAALSAADAVEQEGAVAWPGPIISNPDIARPTGHPYIDSLIHRLLDAQQDINFAANEQMSQSLCDACAVIDEAEAAFRLLATNPKASALAAAREQGRREGVEMAAKTVDRLERSIEKQFKAHVISQDYYVGASDSLIHAGSLLRALLPPAPDAEKPEDTAK